MGLTGLDYRGGILKRVWLQLSKYSASQQSHSTFRNIEKFKCTNEELSHKQQLLIYVDKTYIFMGKYLDSTRRHSRKARLQL